MIHQKDLGNAFAPAYRQNVAVDDAYVPCDAPGRGVEVYVPAWGFLEQARDLTVLDRWRARERNARQYVVGARFGRVLVTLQRHGELIACYPGDDENAARAGAAKALLAEDPSLGEGLYP